MDDVSAPLQDYLRAGIVAADLPDLHPLLSARDLLRAFSTLFHGGEESVMVRLLVLRAIGERGTAPEWSPQELRDHFAYLDAVKFDTVLGRLRENGLLLWDAGSQRYRISPVGRQALSSIGLLLQFNREGDELAYVTAQLAAGQSSGRVGANDLQHLLSRLNELREDFDQAVLSGSEHRIREAAATLQSVWQWVEKGTGDHQGDRQRRRTRRGHAPRRAAGRPRAERDAAPGLGVPARAEPARPPPRAPGRERPVVLRRQPLSCAGWMPTRWRCWPKARSRAPSRRPSCWRRSRWTSPSTNWSNASARRRKTPSLPPAQDAPDDTQAPVSEHDYAHAEQWLAQMAALDAGIDAPLSDWVPQDGFAVSAYRLSLLGLIGDPGAENRNGVSAAIAQLPLRWKVSAQFEDVNRAGVAYMSRAWLVGKDVADDVDVAGADDADIDETRRAVRSHAVVRARTVSRTHAAEKQPKRKKKSAEPMETQ